MARVQVWPERFDALILSVADNDLIRARLATALLVEEREGLLLVTCAGLAIPAAACAALLGGLSAFLLVTAALLLMAALVAAR